jgi:hypothetical protein
MSRIITLYHGSGSLSYSVEGPALSDEDWGRYRQTALKVLAHRGKQSAARFLETEGFCVHKGANDFGDEFNVLYRTVTLDDYDRYDALSRSPDDRAAFEDIAKTITEIGPFIRFVGVELVHDAAPLPVASPRLKISSDVVERALIDAERLITSNSPVSAVDRAHTSLHGFLKQVCSDAGLKASGPDPSLTDVLKLLREQHPKFNKQATHNDEASRVLKAMGAICDALNTIRNRGSMAHPNEKLLAEAEAMLAINASRTILHYIHHKLET